MYFPCCSSLPDSSHFPICRLAGPSVTSIFCKGHSSIFGVFWMDPRSSTTLKVCISLMKLTSEFTVLIFLEYKGPYIFQQVLLWSFSPKIFFKLCQRPLSTCEVFSVLHYFWRHIDPVDIQKYTSDGNPILWQFLQFYTGRYNWMPAESIDERKLSITSPLELSSFLSFSFFRKRVKGFSIRCLWITSPERCFSIQTHQWFSDRNIGTWLFLRQSLCSRGFILIN